MTADAQNLTKILRFLTIRPILDHQHSDVGDNNHVINAWSDGFIRMASGFKQFFFSSFVHVPRPLCQHAQHPFIESVTLLGPL